MHLIEKQAFSPRSSVVLPSNTPSAVKMLLAIRCMQTHRLSGCQAEAVLVPAMEACSENILSCSRG
jgi:hypothetical protein